MRGLLTYLVAPILLLASASGYANPDPQKAQELVEQTTQEMLSVLREEAGEDDVDAIKKRLREIILPRLDFVTMTKLAVGRTWLDASDEQKKALVREFRDLLVRTYSRSLAQYEDQQIEFLPLRTGDKPDRVTVRSRVQQSSGSDIPVHFRLRYHEGEWSVYDITIDGVSLVKTYRSSFSSQVQENGIDGLIAQLKQKNQAGESAQVAP